MTEDQQSLMELMRDFIAREVRPHILEWEKEERYPREIIQMGIDMGLHMMQVPEEYGGMGLDTTTTTTMIGEGAKVESTYMGVFDVASTDDRTVMVVGNEEQKQHYAGLLSKGSISALCLTEPGTGPDSAAIHTTTVRRGGSYVISGTKMSITDTSPAGMSLVVVFVDPSKGSGGLATFIVERDCKGVDISRRIDKLGTRLSNTAEVISEDVETPIRNLVGAGESRFVNAMKALTASRPIIATFSLGARQPAQNLAIRYSEGWVVFRKPICVKQITQEKLTDMEMLTQVNCGLVHHATILLDQGKLYNTEASVARCLATEAFGRIIDQALQIFGGYGLCDEYLISKLYWDARANRIVEGANEIQRVVTLEAMFC